MGLSQLFWEAYQGYLVVCTVFLFTLLAVRHTGVVISYFVLCTLPIYFYLCFQHMMSGFWHVVFDEMAESNTNMFVGFVNRTQTLTCIVRCLSTNFANCIECQ